MFDAAGEDIKVRKWTLALKHLRHKDHNPSVSDMHLQLHSDVAPIFSSAICFAAVIFKHGCEQTKRVIVLEH